MTFTQDGKPPLFRNKIADEQTKASGKISASSGTFFAGH